MIYVWLSVGIGAVALVTVLALKAYKAGKCEKELEIKSHTLDNLYIAKKIRENTKADDYDPFE